MAIGEIRAPLLLVHEDSRIGSGIVVLAAPLGILELRCAKGRRGSAVEFQGIQARISK